MVAFFFLFAPTVVLIVVLIMQAVARRRKSFDRLKIENREQQVISILKSRGETPPALHPGR